MQTISCPMFADISQSCRLSPDKYQTVADLAEVSRSVIEHMCTSKPVASTDAEKVLILLSSILHQPLTLETVSVPLLLPTFPDLYQRHAFTSLGLAIQAHVLPETIDLMLQEMPVRREYVIRVLCAFSLRTGQAYTLRNVQVKVLEGENAKSQ
jgi:hypothetical protein